ncbi:LuxR family transcriptional regulator, maltose regulon positive regulatory protein [Hydrocarboniphaga daqingensis]|uniref:LuxR family transcriptional regulator, maltose regulon positive regulatory protein n=1 Tax=Hydrocarboniphaga daqingensis TaxID=490188 RepID=A0A1M5M063_9GAMM|nr:LuxR C-terminal-related transcriptional regulator [Hydrocarboniphaga daqingensis]SHG70616.1 LuxR family transcriptional regulator, maltose regulon positive regulatory protein [Hydrocarboniphaga daqingensis]
MTTGRPEGERPSAQISTHKLYAPPTYRGVVSRRAILDRVFAEPMVRVFLFQGPAGHGKSTLLQQVMTQCQQRGWLTGWLSFDDADNDMRRFTSHFDALLDGIVGEASDSNSRSRATAPGSRARRSDAAIARLLQRSEPTALFLDELQELSNPGILGFLRELLERLPDRITVFFGSRALPDLGLARLLVNGRAMVLRADELRFSTAEAEQFFAEARDLGVQQDEVAEIHRQTEGWPAALQLFRLSLASPNVRGALGNLNAYRPRELADYLADNVVSLQTPRIREFLLRTSLLTRLSAPLCDELLGWQDSQSILLFLERNGLFLRSLDSDLRWFKYHTLFSGFLQEQLNESDPASLRELHGRAAHWYHAHGFHDEAMHHAVEAGEFSFAAGVMNLWSSRLVAEGHLATVERWYDRLPLDEIAPRRELAVKIAYALSFLRRHRKLRPLMEVLDTPASSTLINDANPDVVRTMVALLFDDIPRAFELVHQLQINVSEPEPFRAFELSAACNVLGYHAVAIGEYERAREYVMRSRAYSDKAHARFSGGYSVAVAGINLLVQGELQQAIERFRAGLAEQHADAETSVASASLVSCYIMALYDADELTLAESLFAQFHDVIREGVLLDFMAVAYVSMARIHDARGAAPKAQELLDEAENIGHLAAWPRMIRIIDRERVRRHLLRGERDRAQLIASRIPQRPEFTLPDGVALFSEDSEGDAIGQIRLLIHRGHGDDALTRLSHELDLAQRNGRVRRLIKLRILEALAHAQRGRPRPAYHAMRHALQLAAPQGFVRSFLDEGDEVLKLLRELFPSLHDAGIERHGHGSDSLLTFAARLLGGDSVDGSADERSTRTPMTLAEPLTDGERNILSFLARGVSNKVIAAELFVSENTVKFHLKNIYGKLGASSRLQAINAARRMGLV